MPGDFDFSDKDEAFRRELRALLEAELPSEWTSLFSDEGTLQVSNRVTAEVARRGWLIQHWPREHGGQGTSMWRQTVAQEEFEAYGEPRGGQYMNVNWIGPAILAHGSPEQKAQFIPEMISGSVTWAQLFSEPGAGSDLAAVNTSAILDEAADEFVVNGQKVWTSYGGIAARGFLLARSLPGSRRRQGLSVLLIDMDAPGLEVREIPGVLGTYRQYEEFFTDVRVPASRLLGEIHDGWNVAMRALAFERSGNANYARATRILRRLWRMAGRPSQSEEGPLPATIERVADAMALGRATEMMNYKVVDLKERGAPLTWQASAARIYNALYEQAVAELADEIVGSETWISETDACNHEIAEVSSFAMKRAYTTAITAGTYEIQLSLVAQHGLGLERAR